MKALLQRVSSASVRIDNDLLGSIKKGIVILLGIQSGDNDSDIKYIVDKTINLRIFDDNYGKFNYSLLDINGEILLISQFTFFIRQHVPTIWYNAILLVVVVVKMARDSLLLQYLSKHSIKQGETKEHGKEGP